MQLSILSNGPIVKHVKGSDDDPINMVTMKINANSILSVMDRLVKRIELFEKVLSQLAREEYLRVLLPQASSAIQHMTLEMMELRRDTQENIDMFRMVTNCGRTRTSGDEKMDKLIDAVTRADKTHSSS
jgi:hypothetical protein